MSQTLQQKNTRFLFNRLLILLLGCSVLFYFLMQMQARHMQHKQLELNQLHFKAAFLQNQSIPLSIPGEYTIVESGLFPADRLNITRDTSVFDAAAGKHLPYEILTGEFQAKGKRYQLTTYVSSTEISHLIIKVFLTEAGILALLFVAIIYINHKTSGLLWRPFRETMQQLGAYDVTQSKTVQLERETGITEFNELNSEISSLIERTAQAYHNQKQFVENASHEMQTPLAVMRSKLELLINQPDITEDMAVLLSDITASSDRLSQMNRSLLLLAKIENNQFPEKRLVNVGELLLQTLDNYQRYYGEDFPCVNNHQQDEQIVNANPGLMEILLGNLVKNAVIHNIPSGQIDLILASHTLIISNTGPHITTSPENLFERFRKGNPELKSTGLGLALVKQICRLYGFTPAYEYQNGIHRLSIRFA